MLHQMTTAFDALLPAKWVDGDGLDDALHLYGDAHSNNIVDVSFRFPNDCRIMVDAAVRLLSLANQLCYLGKKVSMTFEEGLPGTMGYLDRIGFFNLLSSQVNVRPALPPVSGLLRYQGANPGLVEIQPINPIQRDHSLPTRLADIIKEAAIGADAQKALGRAAFTVLGELIDNVFQHSSTKLDGYAALQYYKGRAKVIVSDSGIGLLETLRPALQQESSTYARLKDVELLVAAFRSGLSRFGQTRGMGLRQSAETALKYNADLHVRLPRIQVHLSPQSAGYGMAHIQDGLPLLWGTHVTFDFHIDQRQ